MKLSRGKLIFFVVLALLVLSVVLALGSFYPVAVGGTSRRVIIDDSFNLTAAETYRQGLGSFRGNENISLAISGGANCTVNFALLTYTGPQYNVSAVSIDYSFAADADYYEAVFVGDVAASNVVSLQVSIKSPAVTYPLSWLVTPAKALFFASWAALMLLILKPEFKSSAPSPVKVPVLCGKSRRWLLIVVLLSLVFWIVLLTLNTNPLGTFEGWYTDSARNSYSATLFPKVGFSIFDTPLGHLSSGDGSFFKFVTWPEMPHLYPIGSVLLYLPFGALLEAGITQALVLKLEIALFLVASHACLYYFLKRFWKTDLNYILKVLVAYLFYVVLVVYSANGQFDTVAFLFSMLGLVLFLATRYDLFLLSIAVSATIKYQAVIFLIPLVIVGLLWLFRQSKIYVIMRNKAVLAVVALVSFDLFTAYLSLPFLTSARPELVMNGVNAFSPHAQLPWVLQAFAVLSVLLVTLGVTVYLRNKSRLISLFAVFSLVPCFTMPYFQPWYLPFFFVYLLLPQQKRTITVTVLWLIFLLIMLAFGGLVYNPLAILDRIRDVLAL